MADDEFDNIILEEGEEDYEPPQEEIIAYAKYLGFDLPDDADLIEIAKEGLKAPLPSPWKACQTKEGEIYYFNPETEESTWDHPLDDFYKQKFKTAKLAKLENLNKSKNGEKGDHFNLELSPEPNPMKKGEDHGEDNKNFSTLLDKLSPIAGESFSHRQKSELKENLLQREIEEFRKKKDEEFLRKKQELEDKYHDRINKAEQENQLQLQNLIEETNKKLEDEKSKITQEKLSKRQMTQQSENRVLDEYKLKFFETSTEKKRLAIDSARSEYEKKVMSLKENLAKKKSEKLSEVKQQLEKKKADELADLEKNLNDLQTQVVNLSMNDSSPLNKKNQKLEEEQFKNYLSHQEDQFYDEKLKIIKVYEEKCKELKAIEFEKHKKEMDNLQRLLELSDDQKFKEEEENYIKSLELENQNKLSLYQQELLKKKEAAKASVLEKYMEIEKKKYEEIQARFAIEYKNKMNEWIKEKTLLEERFIQDKNGIENNYNAEFFNYKNDTIHKFNQEISELESKKAEKTKRLNQVLQDITMSSSINGRAVGRNQNDVHMEYQNKIKQLNEILLNKNMDIKNLTAKKFHLESELASLQEKITITKKECDELAQQTDCESLNNLFDHLTKKLSSKEQELKSLQEEKKLAHNTSNQILYPERNVQDSMQMDLSVQYGATDIEKIVKELETLKQELKQDKENEEEDSLEEKKRNNPNKSFSHFGASRDKSSVIKKRNFAPQISVQGSDVAVQIKSELSNLNILKTKIQKDLNDFNREFANTEIKTEMKSYYTSIRSVMQEKLEKIEKKQQNLEYLELCLIKQTRKFLLWADKVQKDKLRDDDDFSKINKTLIVEGGEYNIEDL